MKSRGLPLIISLLVLCYISLGFSQEQIAYSYSIPNAINEYTVQHDIDIDDMPGHKIRIATITTNEEGYANLEPAIMFNGIKVVSSVASFSTDYVNFNGTLSGYMTYQMENGDKIFAELKGATQTRFKEDGSLDVSHYSGVDRFVGGTGVFEGIRGLFRHTSITDPTRNVGPTTDRDGSYWFVAQ